VRPPPGAHPGVEVMQTVLRAVGDLQDVLGLPGLAVAEGHADPGLAGVVPGRLDQQPPGEGRPRLRDRPLARGLAGLVQ
jgi:hypothetical protein